MSLNPARQSRVKRLSREDEDQEEAYLPTSSEVRSFAIHHRTVLVAAFVVSFVYFADVVSPLVTTGPRGVVEGLQAPSPAFKRRYNSHQAGTFMATGSLCLGNDLETTPKFRADDQVPSKPDASSNTLLPFKLTCAIVHTFIIAVGIALGRDSLSVRDAAGATGLILRVGVASFVFLCGVFWWAWEYKIGPVPVVGESLFSSEEAFVLIAALHTTAWLLCSMAVPHSPLGHMCTSSSKMHIAIAMMGAAVHASELSVGSSCAVFGAFGAAGLLAAQLVKAERCAPFLVHSL